MLIMGLSACRDVKFHLGVSGHFDAGANMNVEFPTKEKGGGIAPAALILSPIFPLLEAILQFDPVGPRLDRAASDQGEAFLVGDALHVTDQRATVLCVLPQDPRIGSAIGAGLSGLSGPLSAAS